MLTSHAVQIDPCTEIPSAYADRMYFEVLRPFWQVVPSKSQPPHERLTVGRHKPILNMHLIEFRKLVPLQRVSKPKQSAVLFVYKRQLPAWPSSVVAGPGLTQLSLHRSFSTRKSTRMGVIQRHESVGQHHHRKDSRSNYAAPIRQL